MMGFSVSQEAVCVASYTGKLEVWVYFSAEHGVNIAGDTQKRFCGRAGNSQQDGT
jgi:hypothetical protein